jgi:hypothetical protein
VFKQIEQSMENIANLSQAKQGKMKAILNRYATEEINLDQAYYDLLEDELIPMPKRCGLSAKIPVTEEDEKRLKEKIRAMQA